jgi:hypothetical protein
MKNKITTAVQMAALVPEIMDTTSYAGSLFSYSYIM